MDLERLRYIREKWQALDEAEQRAWLPELRLSDPEIAEILEAESIQAQQIEAEDAARSRAERAYKHGGWIARKLNGRYRILRELGSGASSRVFAAHDENLDREVVVKILGPDSGAMRERELKALVKLPRHPGIVTVFDAGHEYGLDYIVMEKIDGESLAERRKRDVLTWTDALRIVMQVGEALGVLHAHGVYHRDIKPANIMLGPEGRQAVVIDFGIAHLSKSRRSHTLTLPAGTGPYMAPEVFLYRQVSPKSELYALAVVLVELLDPRPRQDRPAKQSLKTLRLPAPYFDAIRSALDDDPDKRPEIPTFLTQLQTHAPQRSAQSPPPSRRMAIAGAAGGAIATGAFMFWPHADPVSVELQSNGSDGMRLSLQVNRETYLYVFADDPLTRLWPGDDRVALLGAGEHLLPRDGWWRIPRDWTSLWLLASDDLLPHLSQGKKAGEVESGLAASLNGFLSGGAVREVRPGWRTPVGLPANGISVRIWLPRTGG